MQLNSRINITYYSFYKYTINVTESDYQMSILNFFFAKKNLCDYIVVPTMITVQGTYRLKLGNLSK